MTDYYRIDNHKLMFHIDRLRDWLAGKLIYPIYLEIAPAGGCNHRCIFCALDYLGYAAAFIDTNTLKSTIKEAGRLGVKSIMYAGEGEPLLHEDILDILKYTRKSGIDTSITTNGVLLNRKLSGAILGFLSWIRFSLNAGSSKNYAKIHRTRREDFRKVVDNIKEAVKIRNSNRLGVVIGVQSVLIPENAKEILSLGRLLKDLGVDYFTVKPYSQHPLSHSSISRRFKYKDHAYLKEELDGLEDKHFHVVFREDTINRLNMSKDYKRCLGLPFWAYINACGDVYACSAFLGKNEFCYGNIYKTGFKDIMIGKKRTAIIKRAGLTLDINKCRQVCRLDKINSYLWELTHPGPHVNFI